MYIIKKIVFTIAFFTTGFIVRAQSNEQKAKEIGKAAVKLEDEGKPDEALPLLKQARELDPDNYVIPYEMAYCYEMKKDYKQGISVMRDAMKMKGARDDCYQMLGNLYDMNGDSVMALNTYSEGFKKYPGSGRLYLETGNVYFNRKQYVKALPYYEKGIEADPVYPSNYYRAAQIYTSSSESMWGMIYGEIFMNLERNTGRTADVSKWLYDTYRENIVIHSKDSMEVHFCHNMVMEVDENTGKDGKEIRLPYNFMYEPLILQALVSTEIINMEALCSMRKNFIDMYYEHKFDTERPNVLFAYERTIEKAGYADAYNHWILMKGDEEAFNKWQGAHQKKWDDFRSWFNNNQIKITKENAFVKSKA